MFHTIDFRSQGFAELEKPDTPGAVQAYIKAGVRIRAKIKPYVVESDKGPVEVADLYSEDGSVARAMQYAHFRFIDD